jgi:hypothetical protein
MSFNVENPELGRTVLNLIDTRPEQFDMGVWGYKGPDKTCGSVACLAGHTLLAAGYTLRGFNYYRPDGTYVRSEAAEAEMLLGMTGSDGNDTLPLWLDFMNGPARFREMIEKAEANQP